MKAVVYKEPFSVAVEDVPDPRIQHPNDAIVKITSSCICGSDLHMYEGRTAAEPGIVFGHENMGVIQEVGPAVKERRVGDRVVMPFNVACGFCKNCLGGFTGFCTTVNPGFAGGAYGYVSMGPWVGGQAEYLQVPFADFNCLPLPAGTDNEADYAMLADIFPTGYHGAELADVRPGESVAVFGAGPVGLMAAYSCAIRGAAEVYVIDHVQERLDKAAEIGAIPINFDEGNPVDQIKDRRGDGVDKGIDAVGYQAAIAGSAAAGGEQDEASEKLRDKLKAATWEGSDKKVFNIPVALSLMVFFALCAQCAATLAVIKRETNSWRWPIFSFTYMTVLAYVGALLTYHVSRMLIS